MCRMKRKKRWRNRSVNRHDTDVSRLPVHEQHNVKIAICPRWTGTPPAYRGHFVLYSVFMNDGKVWFWTLPFFFLSPICEIFKTVFQNGPLDSYWCKEQEGDQIKFENLVAKHLFQNAIGIGGYKKWNFSKFWRSPRLKTPLKVCIGCKGYIPKQTYLLLDSLPKIPNSLQSHIAPWKSHEPPQQDTSGTECAFCASY